MAFPLDWQVWAQDECISWWAMDLVGKPNTKSQIWNHFPSCHPSAFVQVSSSSGDRKHPAGQVCIGEAFSKLAKYERDSGKWKMLTRNMATYGAIPITQRARATDEELTCPLVWWQNSEMCLNHEMCLYIYIYITTPRKSENLPPSQPYVSAVLLLSHCLTQVYC